MKKEEIIKIRMEINQVENRNDSRENQQKPKIVPLKLKQKFSQLDQEKLEKTQITKIRNKRETSLLTLKTHKQMDASE